MKKEWLFFCVFCISVICSPVSSSQHIATFTCAVANKIIDTPLRTQSDQLTHANDSLENNNVHTIKPAVKLAADNDVFK